jgi:hypothetical protein
MPAAHLLGSVLTRLRLAFDAMAVESVPTYWLLDMEDTREPQPCSL